MKFYQKARPAVTVIGAITCLLSCVLAITRDDRLAESIIFGLVGLIWLSNVVKYLISRANKGKETTK